MSKRSFITYLVKFLGAFFLLYLGTKAVIGLTVTGGYYSPFIAHYLDYPGVLRSSLLNGTKLLAGAFGFNTYLRDAYHVTVFRGLGVHLVYSCLGYGLLSFWIAFVFANNGSFARKFKWMLGGCFLIWLINVIRITLVLIAVNQRWAVRLTLDNHTVFNIVVYLFIFLMIYLFTRAEQRAATSVSSVL